MLDLCVDGNKGDACTVQQHSNSGLTAEKQLILLSAGTAARRQASSGRAEALGGLVHWPTLADLLRTRRLLPLLGPRLVELGGEQAGSEFAITVENALDASRRRGVLWQMIADHIKQALAEAEIRCVVLKGSVLSEALYDDPGRRLSSDIDLLVAQEDLHDAVRAVCKLGYRAPTDYTGSDGLPSLHFTLSHEDDQLPPVEVHWRIHWYEDRFAGERLLPPRGECAHTWRPAPIDELAASLLFYARDGFIDLRLATDLGACWDAVRAGIGPQAFGGLISAYPALEGVLSASAAVGANVVGLPGNELTGGNAELRYRSRMAVQLATPHSDLSTSQLYANMGLIDGLLAPPGGFGAFLRRRVIPPREVLNEQARKARRSKASSRTGHCVRVLARYVLAIAGLIARRGRKHRYTVTSSPRAECGDIAQTGHGEPRLNSRH